MILTDIKGRSFKVIRTPIKITKSNFLLDDITNTMYCEFGYDEKYGEYITGQIPYDKLNLAGGFTKINY